MCITEKACPMWVPLVETGEADGLGADYFVKKYVDECMAADPDIDTLILGCTHYPLLLDKNQTVHTAECQNTSAGRTRGGKSRRLPSQTLQAMERECTKEGSVEFLTTESPDKFDSLATLFMQSPVASSRITL